MIKQIILLDFRGHNRTLVFGPGLNRLRGPNESGKSTVKEAIAFAWYGTDSSGTKNPDHLISDGRDAAEVMLVTEHAKISRRKRRGQTSAIKIERHGFPPVTMNQTELNAVLKLSLESFMSCWNVGYFMSMQSTAQLAVLAELAKVDRRALLQSMLPSGTVIPAKIKLINPKIDADAMASERRQLQNMKASDVGALEQVKIQLSQLATGADVDIESYSQSLNSVNAKLEAWDFYKRALAKYQTDKMRWGESINRKGSCEAGLLALRPVQTELIRAMEDTAEKNRRKIEDLRASIRTLTEKAKPLPPAPKKPDGLYLEADAICDKCGQKIDVAHVKHIMAGYEKELLEYNKEAREVQTHNDRLKVAIQKGNDAIRDVDIENTQLTAEIQKARASNRATEDRKVELERELADIGKIREPAAPAKPEGDETALRKDQLDLNTTLNLARRQSTQLQQLRTQQELLEAAVKTKDQQIMACGALEHSLKNLPAIEAKQLLETLHVEGVTVDLNEGNLVIMGGNIPYASLSSGRQMKVDLAFCMSLRNAGGAKAPSWVFADDSDLMDRFHQLLPYGVQVFSAEVDAELKEVQVITDDIVVMQGDL